MPKQKKSSGFHVQLAHTRVRVALARRQSGGPLYARFWLLNRQYLKCTDCFEEEGARQKAKTIVEEAGAGASTEELTLDGAVADCMLDRWPRLEEKMRAEEKKQVWEGELTEEDNRKKSHWSVTRLQLAKFREYSGKKTNVRALTFESARSLVQRFIDSRVAADAAPQTVVDEQRIVSKFFSWVIKKRLVTWQANPAFKQFLQDLPAINRNPRKPVSESDLKTLLTAASKTDVWPAVLLTLQVGMRPIGTTRIRWNDVDFDTGKVTVTEKRKTRSVPLNKWVLAELAAWKISHPGEYVIDCHKNTLHNHIQRIREKHGLRPEVTLQGCRRTFISLCLDKGVPAELVASIAGNSVAVIERHYKDLRTLKSEHVPETVSLEGLLKPVETDVRIKNRITEAG